MNTNLGLIRISALALLGAGCMAAAAQAPVSTEGLRSCRALASAAERLACYDALADRALSGSAAAAPAGTAPAARPPGTTSATAPAASPAAAPGATAEAAFGLPAATPQVQEVRTHFPGQLQGWERNTRLHLANGQVWQVIDGGSVVLYLRDPVVVVRRAATGGFWLEVQGTNHSPRVRRIQ